MSATQKHVYLFSELDQVEADIQGDWDSTRGLLGDIGANLADMTRLGVPVPPGLTPSPPNHVTLFWRRERNSPKGCGSRCWKD